MSARTICLTLWPVLLVAQPPASELKRAALLEQIDSGIAESFAAREVGAPEIVAPLQRIATRMGAGALEFRLTRGTSAELYEIVPAGGRLFVPEELIRRVRDDEELTGVLAHALAHRALGPALVEAPPDFATIRAQLVVWPAPEGMSLPIGARAAATELERRADAGAVEVLGRVGMDASGLLRYLERSKAADTRLAALRTEMVNMATIPAPAPLTSECEIIQEVLDEIAGKRKVPTLLR